MKDANKAPAERHSGSNGRLELRLVSANNPSHGDKRRRFPVHFDSETGKGADRVRNKRILLVEDETDIAELVALHLENLCDEVVVAGDGHSGLELALGQQWSLVILDLRLPGPDGLQICRAIRRENRYQPVMMLTSKSSELDRVLGLDTGADDYLAKPFSVLELVARVRAILRRVDSLRLPDEPTEDRAITAGRLSIDPSRREVLRDGATVELTAREFDLLTHFAQRPGRVFRRSDLLDSVWGTGHEGYEHTVNSHINRLRAKIEDDPSDPQIIVTVWGVGYKFEAPSAAA